MFAHLFSGSMTLPSNCAQLCKELGRKQKRNESKNSKGGRGVQVTTCYTDVGEQGPRAGTFFLLHISEQKGMLLARPGNYFGPVFSGFMVSNAKKLEKYAYFSVIQAPLPKQKKSTARHLGRGPDLDTWNKSKPSVESNPPVIFLPAQLLSHHPATALWCSCHVACLCPFQSQLPVCISRW